MAGIRRRKIDLCGWAGISVVAKVWLMHDTYTIHTIGKEEVNRQRKHSVTFSCFAFKFQLLFQVLLFKNREYLKLMYFCPFICITLDNNVLTVLCPNFFYIVL